MAPPAHKPAAPATKRTKSISGKESKEADTSKADAASAAEAADLARTWKPAARPDGAGAYQDANFTLEDEALAPTAESLLQCYWISDPTQPGNPLVFVSPAFETLSGYHAQEALGKDPNGLLQASKADPEGAQAIEAALKAGTAATVEATHLRKDGKAWRSQFSVAPITNEQGQLLRWLGLHCEVKQAKEAAAAGDDAASLAAKMAEQVRAHTSAFCLTAGGIDDCPITCTSPCLAQLTGYSQQQLAGCSCLVLAGPDTSGSAMRRLMAMQRGSRHGSLKVLLYKQDGTPFWALVVSCPLDVPEGEKEGKGSSSSSSGGQQSSSGTGSAPAEQHLLLFVDITCARPKKVGKYILGKVLGQGAFGVVRMGKSSVTDELVAIKAVDSTRFRSIDEIEQVQEEMSVLANLKHPNIIRLLEVHVTNSCFYLMMEYAGGGCMVRHIYAQEGHRLSEREAKRIFTQIIAALDYCHRRRVIHRDLKPENILMDTRNNVKVADFGLAAVTAPFNQGQLTLQCGTPEFTAPEICGGKEYDGPAVDLWSMGVMLYEALSGVLPFQGPNTAALFKAIQKGVYEPLPPHISAEAKDLVKKLLAVDPEKRINMWDLLKHSWVRDSIMASSTEGREQEGQEGEGQPRKADVECTAEANDLPASGTCSDAEGSQRSSSPEVVHPSGLSFTGSSKGCHESVRVVIPDGGMDKDDPITAAIMRSASQSQTASFSEPASSSPYLRTTSGPVETLEPGDHTPSSRASSFTSGLLSPATPKDGRTPTAAARLSSSSTSSPRTGPGKLVPPSPSTPSKLSASPAGGDRRNTPTHSRTSSESPHGGLVRKAVARQASGNEASSLKGGDRPGKLAGAVGRQGESQAPNAADARKGNGGSDGVGAGAARKASGSDGGGVKARTSMDSNGPPARIKSLTSQLVQSNMQ